MSIARSELQNLRDRIREHSKPGEHSASIGRAGNEAATALDQLDACLAREGIDCLYNGAEATKSDGQEG